MKKTALLSFLLFPALLLFILFVLIPVVQAGYYSLFRWNGIGPLTRFTGFENFKLILLDRVFQKAFTNNIKVIIVSLLIQLPLAFFFALLLGRNQFRGESFLRSIFFFPYILAEIVSGIIWKFIYNPEFGLPTFFSKLFAGGGEIALMGNPETAFGAI
ncbi:MAG: sugar ABC transporter permease, partial [Spirochaetales bacterium]|nr:sugar ABC transporter permease [Spirochaetales bacterium]